MKITLGKRNFALHEVIGRVLRSDRLARTTTIHTPAHATPDGGSRAASTISTTKVHETMQMVLADGSPFFLQVWNTGLLADEGDVLHTLWLQRAGKTEQTLVAIFNRTTGQEVWLDANLTNLFYLTEPMWKGLVIAFVIGVVGMMLAGMIPFIGHLAILLPIGLPIFTWRLDRRGRAHIAELKRIGGETFRARRGEAFPDPAPR